MTYVEFFDKTALENVCACLTHMPDRVIFIGDSSKLMKRHKANYERVFEDRGCSIELILRTVGRNNLDDAVKLLEEIVKTYDDCVFDITGGEEILLLALGIVYAKYPDRNIQIHKINLRNNVVYDCDKDGVTIGQDTPSLSIEENVRIYGGDVLYGGVDEENTYRWDLTPDFVNDIHQIWGVCKGNVRLWNTQIGVLEAAEKHGSVSEDGLTTVANISAIDDYLARYKTSYKVIDGIMRCLLSRGLITAFDDSDGSTVSVSYKNAQVKRCLTKAGQALEMKVYLTAKNMLGADGAPVYSDVLNGVVIDWDGQFHDEKTEDAYDTENEMDVVLMHGIVPIFISCKNGVVTSDELYKLQTVAQRFGGQYAKKVLITTALPETVAGEYFRQRATDMNIRLIENVQDMDDETLEKELNNLWNK